MKFLVFSFDQAITRAKENYKLLKVTVISNRFLWLKTKVIGLVLVHRPPSKEFLYTNSRCDVILRASSNHKNSLLGGHFLIPQLLLLPTPFCFIFFRTFQRRLIKHVYFFFGLTRLRPIMQNSKLHINMTASFFESL